MREKCEKIPFFIAFFSAAAVSFDASSDVLGFGVWTPAMAKLDAVLCLANSAAAPLGCLWKFIMDKKLVFKENLINGWEEQKKRTKRTK